MADREFIITFDGDKARIQTKSGLNSPPPGARVNPQTIMEKTTGETCYRVFAPDARRAEQIARVMRGTK